MLRYLLGGMVVATVALMAGGSLLYAEAPKSHTGKGHGRCAALAAKLNLTDKQKEEMGKIRTEFHAKEAPLKKQLGTLHHEHFHAIKQVLTEEQRARLPEGMKAEWDRRWQEMAGKLNLTQEQQQKLDKVRAEFRGKFKQLATKEGEKRPEQFRELRHEAFKAIAAELTPEQRSRFWTTFREERHHGHNAAVRGKEHEAFAEKLGLSAEQRKRVEQICSEYAKKRADEVAQLKQLRHEEHTAMAKVLTAEQREKLHELRKDRENNAKKGETGKADRDR